MAAYEIAIEPTLCQFIKEYADDQYCLELLQFFGGYPHARFSWLAVVHALNVNGGRLYVERALRHLINKGVVRTYIEGNNLPLYFLTGDEPLRRPALELAKLDWHQWQLVLRQIYPASAQYGGRSTQYARRSL